MAQHHLLRPIAPGRAVLTDGEGGKVAEALAALFARLRRVSPHHAGLLSTEAEQDPLRELGRLPPTDKRTYREVLAVECLAALGHAGFISDHSSGTTAQPITRFSQPVDELAEQEVTEAAFAAAGVGPGARVLCVDVDMAELAEFYARAARARGAAQIAFLHLSADLARTVRCLRRFAPTHLVVTPSLLGRLWQELGEEAGGLAAPPRGVISVGEILPDSLRRGVQAAWRGCRFTSFYGTTEVGGMAWECAAGDGHHFDPAAFVAVLDGMGSLGREGGEGELLLTTPRHRTQAVVNYRSGDLVRLDLRPCRCGDPRPRLHTIRRLHEAFVFAGYKFAYDTLAGALTERFPDLPPVAMTVQDVDGGLGAVLLRLHLPRPSPVEAEDLVSALRGGIPDLDGLARRGLLRIEVGREEQAPPVGARKTRRLVDRRRYRPD
jgi:phenylacetate-coenzyme A ligase PaaK-like adenylate-forming protein